ncbi:17-beta-hydroxysteroid dehydrogenase 14-like [Oppia nitens]|uniref:17-beta-hydroxysteroid dehydrogenase 14-like n=1 Tax=Oppia nitens TaxID=1686743 RepID=UPI0023DB3CE2|nr:17-beta-hydroxysteroid dehydrogenase 14-like [Oppia nitens]
MSKLLSIISLSILLLVQLMANLSGQQFDDNIMTDIDVEDIDIYDEVRHSRDFNGKVVLVSGSSNGIGAQIVKLYSALGASVVVTGRKADEIHKTALVVQELSPKKLKPLEFIADLAKQDDLAKLLNETIRVFGKLDILVNNAGHFETAGLFEPNFQKSLDYFEHMDINGNIQLSRLAAPYLAKTRGNIVTITTVQLERIQILQMGYQISKAALDVMTKVLALELAEQGVRVNSVSPGIIIARPDLWDPKKSEEMFNHTARHTPLGRAGLPIDIAKAVVFLSSSEATYITGHSLIVDGGLKYNMDSNFVNKWLR